jgi:hypothetical protein
MIPRATGEAPLTPAPNREQTGISGGKHMTKERQKKRKRLRVVLQPPLPLALKFGFSRKQSAAELEAVRESDRQLSVVLVEMFGSKVNYTDQEIEAACDVLDAREGGSQLADTEPALDRR